MSGLPQPGEPTSADVLATALIKLVRASEAEADRRAVQYGATIAKVRYRDSPEVWRQLHRDVVTLIEHDRKRS